MNIITEALRKLKEEKEKVSIIIWPISHWNEVMGYEEGDYDHNGAKAISIYEPEEDSEMDGFVGVEYDDGTFGYVGLAKDKFGITKEEMLHFLCQDAEPNLIDND